MDASANAYFSLMDADYVIGKTGEDGCDPLEISDNALLARSQALTSSQFSDRFQPMGDYGPLPDGSTSWVRKRSGPAIAELPPEEGIALLEHVLEVTPDSTRALQNLAQIFDQLGDDLRAIALREEAIQRDPDNAQSHAALGVLYQSNGRIQEAIGQFETALSLTGAGSSTERLDIYLRLASAYGAVGQTGDAENALRKAVESDPASYEALVRLGDFFVAQGNFADASQTLLEARRVDATRPQAYISLAQVQLLRNDLVAAQEQFQLARDADPASPAPLIAWGDALRQRGRLADAINLYSEAADLSPEAPAAWLLWINTLIDSGNSDTASQLAAALARDMAGDSAAMQGLGAIYRRLGESERSVAAFQSAVALDPGNAGARIALADTLARQGQIGGGLAVLEEGLARTPGRTELVTARGALHVAAGDPQAAIADFQAALQVNPAYWQAANQLARLYLVQGRANLALDVAETALQVRPEVYQLHASAGDALRSLGRPDDALEAYRQAVALAPDPSQSDPESEALPDASLVSFLADLHTRIGNIHLAQRNLNPARSSFNTALRLNPEQPTAYTGLGRLYLTQAQQELRQAGVSAVPTEPIAENARFFESADAYQSALLFNPDMVQAMVGLGDLYATFGQLDQALVHYEDALRLDPGQGAVRDKVYRIYLAQGRGEEVVAFYQDLLRESPDSSAALEALARAYFTVGQPQQGVDAIDLFLARNPENYDALMILGSLLAALCPNGAEDTAQPDGVNCQISLDQAIVAYDRAARADPSTPAPLMEKAATLRLLGRTEEAETAFRQTIDAIEAQPNGPAGDLYQAYTGLARLLAAQGRYEEADAVAQQIAVARPDIGAVSILQGDLLRTAGRQQEALTAYRQAVQLAPEDPLSNSRVGDLALATGQLADARAAFELALAASPTDRNSQIGMARVLTQQGGGDEASSRREADLQRARSLLDAVLAVNENDIAARLALGDTLLAQGQPAEAVTAYQAVLAQQPDNAAAVDSLAEALLAGGNADEALGSYRTAIDTAETAEERQRWRLTLASTLRSLGRLDEAEAVYQEALAEAPGDITLSLALGNLYLTQARPEEALVLFEGLGGAAFDDPRIGLALGTAALRAGDIQRADEVAQEMLTRSPSAYQPYLLAGRVAQATGDEAATLTALRQATALAPTNGALHSQAADVFQEMGRLDEAATAYKTALSLDRRSVDALVGLSRVYLRQNLYRQAEEPLRRAVSLAPSNAGALSTLGRLLLLTGKAGDAVPLLESAAALQIAQQGAAPATTLTSLADALLASGQVEEGLAIYLEQLELSPEQAPLVIAQALLNAGQNDRAVESLTDLAGERPEDPEPLALLGQVLRQIGRAEEALEPLEQAEALDPNYLPATVIQGDALLDLARFPEAEASYRIIVDRLQGTPAALQPVPVDADAPLPVFAPVEPWRAWTGLARSLQAQGRLDEALALALEIEGARPDVLQTPLLTGDLYRALGEYDDALAAYDRAAVVAPRLATPLERQADTHLRAGQFAAAQQAFEDALALDPTSTDALLGLARAYSLAGEGTGAVEFRKAEARLREAAEFAPDSPSPHLALGDLYLAYGRPDDAAEEYGLALELLPGDLLAMGRLGGALMVAGNADEAINVFEARTEQAPTDKGALLDLAAAYRAVDRFDEAETIYDRLRTLDPNDLGVMISLGDLYLEQDAPERALPLYQEVVRRTADRDQLAQAQDQLGKAYLRAGDITQASASADQLIATRPDLYRGYQLQGTVREASGDLEGALAAYAAGAAQASDPLSLQLRQGDLLLRLERPVEAQTLFEDLTQRNPRSAETFVGLAQSHIAQADDLRALRFEWARSAIQTALQLDPKLVTAQTAQGDLLLAYDRAREAAEAYSKALALRTGEADDTVVRFKLAAAYAASGQWEPALQEYQRVAIANPDDLGLQMALANAYREAGTVAAGAAGIPTHQRSRARLSDCLYQAG